MVNELDVKGKYETGKWREVVEVLVTLVTLGSIWGCLEAVLGGALHLTHFAYKGAIMGGIGMSIMATFVAIHRRPALVIGVAFTAALFKPLSALIYGQPFFAQFVVNPAIAIIMEGLAFSLVASFLFKSLQRRIIVRAGEGLLVGYLSIISWGIVASLWGVGNWAFMDFPEKINYALINGTALAIVGVILLPLGYIIGTRVQPRLSEFRDMRPKFFYTTAVAVSVFCWAGAGFAFTMGL